MYADVTVVDSVIDKPVTVTVCGVLQIPAPDGVNVTDVGLTVPSVTSLLDVSPIVTVATSAHCSSTTVNVAVPPASVVGPLEPRSP